MAKSKGGPGFKVRHKIGVEMSRHLEPVFTYEEIGQELGITKQNAYHEAMLALGKLTWHMRRRLIRPQRRSTYV